MLEIRYFAWNIEKRQTFLPSEIILPRMEGTSGGGWRSPWKEGLGANCGADCSLHGHASLSARLKSTDDSVHNLCCQGSFSFHFHPCLLSLRVVPTRSCWFIRHLLLVVSAGCKQPPRNSNRISRSSSNWCSKWHCFSWRSVPHLHPIYLNDKTR